MRNTRLPRYLKKIVVGGGKGICNMPGPVNDVGILVLAALVLDP